MAVFSGFRPFLTKGSTINGVQNTFFADGTIGAHYVPSQENVYNAGALANFNGIISIILDSKSGNNVLGQELLNASPNFNITRDSTQATSYSAGINLIAGKRYLIECEIESNIGTISIGIRLAGSGGNLTPTASIPGLQNGKFVFFVRVITSGALSLNGDNAGVNAILKTISVKEVVNSIFAEQGSVSLRPLHARAPLAPRRNIVERSEEFHLTPWSLVLQGLGSTPTVTPNYATAPNGTNTATRLQCSRTATGTADRSRVQQSVTYPLGATLSRSIWVKSTSGASQVIQITDSSENNSSNLVTVGSEWERVTITYNAALSANGNFWIGLLNAETTALTTDVLIWGAQLEIGPAVTNYQRIGFAGDITEPGIISYPFIRFDFSDDVLTTTGVRSNKNFLLASEEFDNGTWVKGGVTILPNTEIAPDGTLTADKIVGTNGHVGGKLIYQSLGTISSYVYSFYAKAAEYYLIRAIEAGNFRYYATFDLNTQTVSATGGTNFVSAQIQSVGNNWYRCSIVTNTTTGGSPGAVAFPDNITPPTNTPASYTGGGVSGAYFWGAQIEPGLVLTEYEYGGFSGDIFVSGRNGSAVTNTKLPTGTFTIGPTTYTGGTPGILRAIGDVVGYSLIGKNVNSIEKQQLISYYKSRSAKGVLIPGPELISNSNFDNDISGWTGIIADLEAVDGGMKITHNNFSNAGRARTNTTIIVPGAYLVEYDVLNIYGDAVGSRVQIGDQNANMVATRTSGSFTPSSGTGRKSFVVMANPGSTTLEAFFGIFVNGGTTSGSGGILVDNISVREVRPEEEW
jgi:hypothetical protein